MAQHSWPWSTVAGLGDGSAELTEALSREFLALHFGVQDPTVEGVSHNVLNELAVTGVASPLSVATGSAICYGLYFSDAVVTLAVATPAIGTTGGRVVLQTNWAGTGGAGLEARTRLAVKMSADGNPAIPALTQAFGTTWEISLATFTITVGGVITVTDDRTFRRPTTVVNTDDIVNNAVDDTKIRNSAALSVIGRSVNSVGDPADIVAGDHTVLHRSGGLLLFGDAVTDDIANLAITTAKLANDSVDDTKAGNRVPQFYRRQGGSATIWSTNGTSDYTPTAVRMQGGTIRVALGGGNSTASTAITFPVAFSYAPIVTLGILYATGAIPGDVVVPEVQSLTASGCVIAVRRTGTGAAVNLDVYWLAIGPE